ncbi:FtsX-like permease family protein [Mycoplasma sp. NEAQ87857]|uniref:ABC transporter permease n=1 Tax=Mycoplasma sp. NEAQ87857 TaxID=2683967 RepID=UPI0013169BA3|nr:ABC transporter permease [Mycoplasma sp. NEAQ87857]QGZ97469.1 FtsX-like permease family protein [Mycoplasma sp. NEAQ87857]
MKNLFKEVFKSLTKNKVVVAGLTLLIFLTTGIFTLINSVGSAMNKQFNNYKNESKAHNLTVDLNLPVNGNAYNDGYYLNGLTKSQIDNQIRNNQDLDPTFIKYNEANSETSDFLVDWDEIKKYQTKNNSNNLPLYKQGFVNLSNFKPLDNSNNNLYLSIKDLTHLFDGSETKIHINADNNSLTKTFSVINDYKLPLYVWSNDAIINLEHQVLLNDLNTITLDKTYKLSDIAYINNLNNKVYLSQLQTMFINLKTKVATFDILVKNDWRQNNEPYYAVDINQIANNLGFKLTKDNVYVKDFPSTFNTNLINYASLSSDYLNGEHNLFNLNLKTSFNINQLIGDINTLLPYSKYQVFYTFKPNQEYNLPIEWITKRVVVKNYLRKHYTSTYDDLHAKDWDGTYKSYIENIKSTNNNVLPEYLKEFSFWQKSIKTLYFKYNTATGLLEKIPFNSDEQKGFVSYNEINNALLYFSKNNSLLAKYQYPETKTISQIENKDHISLDQYPNYITPNIKSLRFNIIKDGALKITKLSIYNKAIELINNSKYSNNNFNTAKNKAELNHPLIGVRESITVDSFNNNKKQVFHFVNTGDEHKKIDGITNNLDQLINDPNSTLNIGASELDNVYKTKQLPPYLVTQYLNYAAFNFSIDPNFVKPKFDYVTLYVTNPLTKETNTFYNAKIYYLSNIDKNGNYSPSNGYAIANQIYNKDGKTFVIVKKTLNKDTNQYEWHNVVYQNIKDIALDQNDLLALLELNQWTLDAKIDPAGWATVVPGYSNNVYVPLGIRSPKPEIVAEAKIDNNLSIAINNIEKALLNSQLSSLGFLTNDEIYALIRAIKISFAANDFYKIFANNTFTFSILPKLMLDTLYELTHNPNGDYLAKIVDTLFNRVKHLVTYDQNNIRSIEQQKQYLIQQLISFKNFANNILKIDFLNEQQITALVNLSKDPLVVIDAVKNIINSVDWVSFTNFTKEFTQKFHNKYYDAMGNEVNSEYIKAHLGQKFYQYKYSIHEIILWLLKSINVNKLKTNLITLVDNIDIKYALNTDFENQNNLIKAFLPFVPDSISNIINQINAYNKNSDQAFSNLLDGVKYFIKAFDLDLYRSILDSKIKQQKYEIPFDRPDHDLKISVRGYEYIIAGTLKDADFIYAFFKSIFNTPGSNKRFKDELIKMFNLSSKATTITYDKNLKLQIPASDPNKLDLFDFFALANPSGSSNSSNNQTKHQPPSIEQLINQNYNSNTFYALGLFIQLIKNQTHLSYDSLLKSQKYLASLFFEWNSKTEINQAEITKQVNKWQKILNLLAYAPTDKLSTNSSLGAVIDYFKNFGSSLNDNQNALYQLISGALNQFLAVNWSNDYDLIKFAYPIFEPWWKIYGLENIDLAKKVAFANDLLKLFNQKELIDQFNSFEFPLTFSNNLATVSNGFGVSISLADPLYAKNILFTKQNDQYTNSALAALVAKYPEFKQFINDNELLLTKNLSYLAASDMYYGFGNDYANHYPYKGLFANVINSLINGVFKQDIIYHNYKIINNIFVKMGNYKSFSSLGISDVLLNPLLRNKTPQLLLWLLVNSSDITSSDSNNANLAYLISNKLANFESIFQNETTAYEFINDLFFNNQKAGFKPPTIESNDTIALAIDNDKFIKFQAQNDVIAQTMSPFGLNLIKLQLALLNSITDVNYEQNLIRFSQSSAYLAKVNYAYLQNNHKKIYNGPIPHNPLEVKRLVDSLTSDYKINISGIEFIIIGQGLTYDYIYPLIDENNLQVNTQDQAIVYVNNIGFKRIKQVYSANTVKNYLTLNVDKRDLDSIQNNLETFVKQQINDKINLKRVFKVNELDPINPERSTRISIIESMISTLNLTSGGLLIILIVLVSVSIVFVIKRYIANKNKVIGILVSQGYSPLQIAFSLTSFAVIISIIGASLGYITGFVLHGYGMNVLSSYWTFPIQTLSFNPLIFALTIIIPWAAMSGLIILVTLKALRVKPIELMSGLSDLNTGALYNKTQQMVKFKNVKNKFSFALAFNGFWKLTSFAISIILASSMTILGLSTFGVFDKAVKQTYKHRSFNFKYDLITPTTEGKAINIYDESKAQLNNSLYVPNGNIEEIERYRSDYFKPGVSEIINPNNTVNGNPGQFDPHIITQFSVNIKIPGASGDFDPWSVIYNTLPDTLKSQVIKVRDNVGKLLERSQTNLVWTLKDDLEYFNSTDNGARSIDPIATAKLNANGGYFFKYIQNPDDPAKGTFWYFEYNPFSNDFVKKQVTVDPEIRKKYRDFLINGYEFINKWNAKVDKNRWPQDKKVYEFFVSFGGIYYNKKLDEVYSYADSQIENTNIKIYGYLENSKYIKIVDNNQDLLKEINDIQTNVNHNQIKDVEIPLIINKVASDLFQLNVGDVIELPILNKTTRYQQNILNRINKTNKIDNSVYKFKVHAINQTFINTEFIAPKSAIDQLVGLNLLQHNPSTEVFNGIFSGAKLPIQLLYSSAIYPINGYWSSSDSINPNNLTPNDLNNIYDAIFGINDQASGFKTTLHNGVMFNNGYTKQQIIKFLNPDFSGTSDQEIINEWNRQKNNAKDHIINFVQSYDNKMYFPIASSLGSKDIEVGYTQIIAQTAQVIITSMSIISFVLAIIILIIVSTILVQENEKNIATLSVLGYSQKEKIKMFFGIYIPFILLALLIAIPITIGIMSLFVGFLTTSALISIPLYLTPVNTIITIVIIFSIFSLTSLLSWRNINKIKAIDLLKGK